MRRSGRARVFEPADRLVSARLQQMDYADVMIEYDNGGIARADANSLLF